MLVGQKAEVVYTNMMTLNELFHLCHLASEYCDTIKILWVCKNIKRNYENMDWKI